MYSSTFGDQHLAGFVGFQKCDGGSHCANKKIEDKAAAIARIVIMEYRNEMPRFLGPMSLPMSITTASFGTVKEKIPIGCTTALRYRELEIWSG